ncbi:hypothetical protein Tco_0567624 [Tanacetum coccineum]
MGSNEETIRLVQEAEKQRLLAQKVQQENTTLSSQFELLKERNRILEGINKDNNYLKEFIEADERAKRYYNQAQSQLVRDRDIIRDLEKQREKLELDVKDHKRQQEEYQKTQTIFKQTQRDKEEKYLNDIIQLQAKNKDLENVVCKMGRSTDTLRLLTNEQKAFRDNLHKSGVGYNGDSLSKKEHQWFKSSKPKEKCFRKGSQTGESSKTVFKGFLSLQNYSVQKRYQVSKKSQSLKQCSLIRGLIDRAQMKINQDF